MPPTKRSLMPSIGIPALRAAAVSAPLLTVEAERALVAAIQAGSSRALGELLLAHGRLVLGAARRFRNARLSEDDLVAEGLLGLVEAARHFDPSREVRFATYASLWVRAYVQRFAMANRRIVGPPSTRNARRLLAHLGRVQRELSQRRGETVDAHAVAAELGVPVEDVELVHAALHGSDVSVGLTRDDGPSFEPIDGCASPEDQLAQAEYESVRRRALSNAMERLDPRERSIVERRSLVDEGESLAQIAQGMGLSRERVRQLEERARHKLRVAMMPTAA